MWMIFFFFLKGTRKVKRNQNTGNISSLLKMFGARTSRPSDVSHPYFYTLPPPMCRGDRTWRWNQLQPKHPWAQFKRRHTLQSLFSSPCNCWHFLTTMCRRWWRQHHWATFQRRRSAWMSKWNISPQAEALYLKRTYCRQPVTWNDL